VTNFETRALQAGAERATKTKGLTDLEFMTVLQALVARKPHPQLKPPVCDMLYYWQWGYKA
jgi:hypothetical protein